MRHHLELYTQNFYTAIWWWTGENLFTFPICYVYYR